MARRKQYGEDTKVMRIPLSMVSQVEAMMSKKKALEEVAAYPPLVEALIDSISRTMNAQGQQVQEVVKETIMIGLELGPPEHKPRLLDMLAKYESSLPDSQVTLAQYESVVRGLFDGIVSVNQPKLI